MKILLKEIMAEKGLTVRQVEELTGVSKSSISYIKNGRIYPNILTLEMLAKGLGVRMTDLIESEYL